MEDNIRKAVLEIVLDVLELEPEEIELESDFVEEYEADSLRKIEILARIEKELKIKIPQEELKGFDNLKLVYQIVEKYVEETVH